MRMRYQDAIEYTQSLSKLCGKTGFLESVWGTHTLSSEGVMGADFSIDEYQKSVTVDEYAKRHLRGMIARCVPYYVDSTLLDMIEQLAPAVPTSARLHPSLFKTPYGCLFFERPVRGMAHRMLREYKDHPATEPAPMSGFAWQADTSGVIIVFLYSWAHNDPLWVNGVYIGNVPLVVMPWDYQKNQLANWLVWHKNHQSPESAQTTNAERFEHSARVMIACLHVMDQVITYIAKSPVDRGAKKRALKSGWQHEPEVHVVTLRKVAVDAHPTAHSVDWSCRWMVREHWRVYHRGMPNEYRVKIKEYLKGPADKPLKAPNSLVFAVTR